jgi:uncharacterized protein YecT (DUF1311 family)
MAAPSAGLAGRAAIFSSPAKEGLKVLPINTVTRAQKVWLTYRDAHIESIYPSEDKASEYRSVYGMCYCTAKKELTEQRTKMLKQWVNGVREGDVYSGSQKFK